jgi:DNA-binding FadR family transcriptional regulator
MRGEKDLLDRAPSLVDQVARRLHDDIVQGRYGAGEKLPTEQHLSEMYGVSRPTVREAIGRLKHDGLVVSRQGAGAFVAEAGASSVFRLDIADFSDPEEIRNIIELLIAIEAAASEHAARRRSPEQLAAIKDQLDAMQAAIDRREPGVEEDLTFHRRIIEATGNPFFRDLSDFLDQRVRRFIRAARSNTARFQGLTEAVQVEHQAIYDAIAAGDGPRAREGAEQHLLNAAGRLEIYLRR